MNNIKFGFVVGQLATRQHLTRLLLGLSLDELQCTNMRVGKLGTQVIAKQIGTHLIQRFAKPLGVNFA